MFFKVKQIVSTRVWIL